MPTKKKTRTKDIFFFVFGLIIIFCAILGITALIIQITKEHFEETVENIDIICEPGQKVNCLSSAQYKIVETIPYGDFNQTLYSPFQSTTDSWIELIQSAKSSIQIACSYFSLNQTESYITDPWTDLGHSVGVDIYNLLIDAHSRGVTIQIVENAPGSLDTNQLSEMGIAEVRTPNTTELFNNGYLHSKFIIVDKQVFYLGSANMDWRSLTQVKELGIVINSTCLTADLLQLFNIYWELSDLTEIPNSPQDTLLTIATYIPECNDIIRDETYTSVNITTWPYTYQAYFNTTHPVLLNFTLNGPSSPINNNPNISSSYLTSSPLELCAPYREYDLDTTLDIINREMNNININVMYYAPKTLYTNEVIYWDNIDAALRTAAIERGVNVNILVSQWNYTDASNTQYLLALDVIDNINVKFFEVPDIPGVSIPHSRVNHAKYVITSSTVSITTSNWSADYFLSTSGVSFISKDKDIISQVQWVFDRDWNSEFTYPVQYPSCSK